MDNAAFALESKSYFLRRIGSDGFKISHQPTFRIRGDVPPEIWNRLGTRILPKLRSGSDLKIGIEFSVTVDGHLERGFEADLKQLLDDLGLTGRLQIEQKDEAG